MTSSSSSSDRIDSGWMSIASTTMVSLEPLGSQQSTVSTSDMDGVVIGKEPVLAVAVFDENGQVCTSLHGSFLFLLTILWL